MNKIFYKLVNIKTNEVIIFDCLNDLLFEQGYRIQSEIAYNDVDIVKFDNVKRKLYANI